VNARRTGAREHALSPANLPPWGALEEPVEQEIKFRPIPEAWRAIAGGTKEAEFKRWRKDLVHELAALVWPTYDYRHHCWSAEPSKKLLEADFELLSKLHLCLDDPINGVAKPEPGKDPVKHRQLFFEEDDVYILIGVKYERYDPAVPSNIRADLPRFLISGFDRKLASLSLQLKKHFQRPRAFQVALLTGRTFSCLWAKLANTPSFVSGHCLQGSLAGVSAYLLFGRDLDLVSADVLGQFTVDIGDRRVFAGVHYPSDNLGSWYTALKILPHVLDDSQVEPAREFLWDAISRKSIVFRHIAKHAHQHSDSVYLPAIRALENVANGGG